MSCCKQWAKQKKKCLQPQCQSAETQTLLLVFHGHAITPKSSEPRPRSTHTRLPDHSHLGAGPEQGTPTRGWLRVRESQAGLLCVPLHLPAQLPQHQRFHRYHLPVLSSSYSVHSSIIPRSTAAGDQYLWKPRFQMPFHQLLRHPNAFPDRTV